MSITDDHEKAKVRVEGSNRERSNVKVFRFSGLSAFLLGLPLLLLFGVTAAVIGAVLLCSVPFLLLSGLRKSRQQIQREPERPGTRTLETDIELRPDQVRVLSDEIEDPLDSSEPKR